MRTPPHGDSSVLARSRPIRRGHRNETFSVIAMCVSNPVVSKKKEIRGLDFPNGDTLESPHCFLPKETELSHRSGSEAAQQ